MQKIRVGILGGTGMVGQRFITLLEHHPWFDVVLIAASPSSAGKKYTEAVASRWKLQQPIPEYITDLTVYAVEEDIDHVARGVDMVFCALDLDKERIKDIECAYAAKGLAVISNNSAHRWTSDIPMIIPEVNPQHAEAISIQRKNRGWDTGFIAVKPNCSIQSYVTILSALREFTPEQVIVTSMQAISGAGKTFKDWPEMVDNVIPYIGGEEDKSEQEPLKIWGAIGPAGIITSKQPLISATCIRVPISDGHMASISVKFNKKPTKEQVLKAVKNYQNPIANLSLPSAPKQCITYFVDNSHPQTGIDRMIEHGMGISMGRLREDTILDWKFVTLSHNTVRGAAGGAILTAELLYKQGYISVSS